MPLSTEPRPPHPAPRIFNGFDLRIRSPLSLPGAPLATGGQPAQWNILLQPETVPAEPDLHLRGTGAYTLQHDELVFHAAGVARYRMPLAHPASLLVELAREADLPDASAILIATALPALLWAHGDLSLHAAAAVLPGHSSALAFTGTTGSGKSRLLLSLLESGAAIVAEDVLRVSLNDPAPTVSGLPACLWQRTPQTIHSADRRPIRVPLHRQLSHATLGALLVLDPQASSRPQRLRGPDAVAAILRGFHRPAIPRLLGLLPRLLGQVAALERSVRVYRWAPSFDHQDAAQLSILPGLHPSVR